jgi:hypothetical protein
MEKLQENLKELFHRPIQIKTLELIVRSGGDDAPGIVAPVQRNTDER